MNSNIPEDLSHVKYPDFEEAVKLCIKLGKDCNVAKSDLTAAFRQICLMKKCWKWLVMKAKNPKDNKWYYFVDKCLPFGAAISCAIFQAFSNALAHITAFKTQSDNINYLDDFFFAALLKRVCDNYVQQFLDICQFINLPVSDEKTEWGQTTIIFLGLMIDTHRQCVMVPLEKIEKALQLIKKILASKKNKTTLRELQELCGFLNFIGKAIVPGRVFTRRLYTHTSGVLKPHHHVSLKQDLKADLKMWICFLQHPAAYCRPFYHLDKDLSSVELDLFTDAAKTKGCGGYYKDQWFIAEWDHEFIREHNPSINYLELYAVTVAVINWSALFGDRKIILFCDNLSVVHMINNSSSNCKNCMTLLRIITLQGLINNVKISAAHVSGISNDLADKLSRLEYRQFRATARKMKKTFKGTPVPMPAEIWPIQNIWIA